MALIPEQSAALWNPDGTPVRNLTVVSARPGTGKTTTVTQYCIDVVEGWPHRPWQGMAVLSYTNVARQEIERKFSERGKSNVLLTSPHFVGTIDAFINQFIFLPFGAKQMEYSGGRPKLVGQPHSTWWVSTALKDNLPRGASTLAYFDCYSLDPDDAPLVVDTAPRKLNAFSTKPAPEPTDQNSKNIVRMKKYAWNNGLACQSDANYLAYKTLVASPILAQSIVQRFPVLVIDEAQDMTAVQHALLTCLIEAGQKQVVLVGDEYQAIYEWNTARPKLFTARKAEGGWVSQTLTETFRCSTAICKMLENMMPAGEAVVVAGAGRNGGYGEPVTITRYSDKTEKSDTLTAIGEVAALLAGSAPHDGSKDPKVIAVVARSGEVVARLQNHFVGGPVSPGKPPEWSARLTKDYLRVVHCLTEADIHGGVSAYETLLFNAENYDTRGEMRKALAEIWTPDSVGLRSYRTILLEDLEKIKAALPDGEPLTISKAKLACDVQLTAVSTARLTRMRKDCAGFEGAKKEQDRLLSSLFVARDERSYIPHPEFSDVKVIFSTVHGVKGETHDGVIFYTRAQTSSCGCPSGGSSNRVAKILTHELAECEQKRIAYVAVSRAAQVLRILAPEASAQAWEELL